MGQGRSVTITKRTAPTRRYTERVERSSGRLELVDVVAISGDSNLSPENRRHVYNALACGLLDGWNPSREAVALLIEAAAGNITTDEYKERVVASPVAAAPENLDSAPPGAEPRS
jgi:Antitoxin VbhA